MGITTDAEERAPFDESGQLVKEYFLANDVALVKLGYLRQLAERGGKLQRRQAMPREALVMGEELRSHTFGKAGRRLFAVSHAWLSVEHPDPSGARREELLFQLAYLLAEDSALIFLDFCSLYQVDKTHLDFKRLKMGERLRPGHPAALTPPQTKSTAAAVRGVDAVFASAVVEVIALPTIHPIENDNMAGFAWTRNRRDYMSRGWCFTEFCIAQHFGRVVNTRLVKTKALLGQEHIVKPEELETFLLKEDIVFSTSSDKSVVLPLYRRFHATVSKDDLIKDIQEDRAGENKQALTAGLSALHWRVRRDFVDALGAKKVSDFATLIAPALAEPDYRVRLAAQDALARMKPVKILTAEFAAKLAEDDTEVRLEAIKGLSKLGAMSYTQATALARQLAGSEVFVVAAAKDALLQMSLAAADAVAPFLAERDAQTRDAAQQILSSFGDAGLEAAADSLAARLRSHVNGGPGDAPRELLRALAAVGPRASKHAETVAKHLGDRDASVRCAALEAILKMEQHGARAAAALLTSHDPEVRVQAIRALKRMGDYGVAYATVVAKRLGDDVWTVRRHTVDFLVCCGPSVVEVHADELRRMRDEDADEDVRLQSAQALEDAGLSEDPIVTPPFSRPPSVDLLASSPEMFPDIDM